MALEEKVEGNGCDSLLSEADNRILDLEESWWKQGVSKSAAIAELGMSNTRYYVALNRILANPQAKMERPELVGRLIRLKERRARERRKPQES